MCNEVKLTNSSIYPFNNSKKTVALPTTMDNTKYYIQVELLNASGSIGDIVVSEKATNGFKLAYTGSAKWAKIRYFVGGVISNDSVPY